MPNSRTGRAAVMFRRYTPPCPDDYSCEEDYLEELEAYDREEADRIEEYRERWLEEHVE